MYLTKTPGFFKPLFKDLTWSFSGDENAVYLTFDDGPTPGVTDKVLDLLDEYNAKATFFCIGEKAAKNASIFTRIKSSGHAIGNHTHHHLNGWKTDDREYLRDVENCNAIVSSTLFRPPYGKITKSQVKQLKSAYKIIMWDVLSGDFDQAVSKEKCLKNVTSNAQPGSVIVMHDSEKAKDKMLYALPEVLKFFTEKKTRFKAIP